MRILNLAVTINEQPKLHDINMIIQPGSIHAIMGPNGSGKSTLVQSLAGHPLYYITEGKIVLNDVDITTFTPDERARKGLFIALQNPCAIPGVRLNVFLKEAYYAITGVQLSMAEFNEQLFFYMDYINLDSSFAFRNVHEGFSGGERKRCEILQLLLLKPKVAILDEIDSGLDVDALKLVAQALMYARQENPEMALLLITHYQRILQYINPDNVHILMSGTFVASGSYELGNLIEQKGYDAFREAA